MAKVILNIGMSLDSMGAAPVIIDEDRLIPSTHEYLFNFLEADFTRLEAYTKAYLSCLVKEEKGDRYILRQIYEELFSIHPFFRMCPSNASFFLNSIFAGYIKKNYSEDVWEKYLNFIAADKYLDLSDLFDYSIDISDEHIFEYLYTLQKNISNWVFISLDNTNQDLAELNGIQRNAVYSILYDNYYMPILKTTIEKEIQLNDKLRYLCAVSEFSDDVDFRNDFEEVKKNPTSPVSGNVQKIIEAAKGITEDCECHIYDIDNLEDLLKLEIYNMTLENIRIKHCKNCGKYFIVEKNNVEYCNRIAQGESKPCSEIGRIRTYEQKIAAENNTTALYRRAYKTHFARIKSGKMTREEFEIWKREAAQKKQETETGLIDFDEYAKWLKI